MTHAANCACLECEAEALSALDDVHVVLAGARIDVGGLDDYQVDLLCDYLHPPLNAFDDLSWWFGDAWIGLPGRASELIEWYRARHVFGSC